MKSIYKQNNKDNWFHLWHTIIPVGWTFIAVEEEIIYGNFVTSSPYFALNNNLMKNNSALQMIIQLLYETIHKYSVIKCSCYIICVKTICR